jgi:hypothetical protein
VLVIKRGAQPEVFLDITHLQLNVAVGGCKLVPQFWGKKVVIANIVYSLEIKVVKTVYNSHCDERS